MTVEKPAFLIAMHGIIGGIQVQHDLLRGLRLRLNIDHIATQNGAHFLGEDDRIGTLAPGKIADLVVVRGDPSSSISAIENVEIIFKDGIGYDSQKLIQSVRGLVGLR